jgi:DNA-directed RNA polymerase specialized sigma24 family protein
MVRRVVFDPAAPSSQLVFAELQKPKVRPRLLVFALWRTQSVADAEDLLEEAILCVCDPDRQPWDPARKTFFLHMRDVMRDLRYEESRSARALHEVVDSGLARDDAMVDGAPLADESLHHHRKLSWLRHLGNKLLDKLKGEDPIAVRSLELGLSGTDDLDEQARILGCPIEEIYDAQRRLKYHGKLIREEDEAAEARRMDELRKKAEAARTAKARRNVGEKEQTP